MSIRIQPEKTPCCLVVSHCNISSKNNDNVSHALRWLIPCESSFLFKEWKCQTADRTNLETNEYKFSYYLNTKKGKEFYHAHYDTTPVARSTQATTTTTVAPNVTFKVSTIGLNWSADELFQTRSALVTCYSDKRFDTGAKPESTGAQTTCATHEEAFRDERLFQV